MTQTHVNMHTNKHAHINTQVHKHTYLTHIHSQTNKHTYKDISINKQIHKYTKSRTHIHAYTNIQSYIHTYKNTQTQTHIDTHTLRVFYLSSPISPHSGNGRQLTPSIVPRLFTIFLPLFSVYHLLPQDLSLPPLPRTVCPPTSISHIPVQHSSSAYPLCFLTIQPHPTAAMSAEIRQSPSSSPFCLSCPITIPVNGCVLSDIVSNVRDVRACN